jgi:hypothetical protein
MSNEPDSHWENEYIESFSSLLNDELLNRDILPTSDKVKALIEQWRKDYNLIQPLAPWCNDQQFLRLY